MNKFVSGKASVLVLTAVLAVFAFMLGTSSNPVDAAGDIAKAYCHKNSGASEFVYHFNKAWDAHFENNGTNKSGHELDKWTVEGDRDCDGDVDPSPSPGVILGCTDRSAINYVPEATLDDGSCEYEEEGTPTPTPTATPTSSTTNSGGQGDDGGDGRGCAVNDCSGNPTPQGQVLGATTMAKTGSFAETLYLAIMGLGGALTTKAVKGLKKAFKKA